MSTAIQKPAAIVFDFDGTIADTQALIVSCFRATYERLGRPAPSFEAIAATIGLPLERAFQQLSGFSETEADEIAAEYRRVFDGRVGEETVPIAGMPEVVRACRALGVPLAVASSRGTGSLLPMIDALGLAGCFREVVGREDVTEEKPAPAMLVEVARRLAVPVTELLMIGDTYYDLEMARRAGCRALGVSFGNHSRQELSKAEPAAIVDAPEKILGLLGMDL
jgi:phosphoglycolate phosphatase